jgi:hypothetical protein
MIPAIWSQKDKGVALSGGCNVSDVTTLGSLASGIRASGVIMVVNACWWYVFSNYAPESQHKISFYFIIGVLKRTTICNEKRGVVV